METTVSVNRVRPERVAGYSTNFVGEGQLERYKGAVVRSATVRVMVILNDEEAQKAIAFSLENLGHPFLFSFVERNRIVGVELVEAQPARV